MQVNKEQEGFIGWLKWWFFETKKCDHIPGQWHMIELGMGKARWCKKCGKLMNRI